MSHCRNGASIIGGLAARTKSANSVNLFKGPTSPRAINVVSVAMAPYINRFARSDFDSSINSAIVRAIESADFVPVLNGLTLDEMQS
jgi:hypothetical protein